MLHNSGKTEYFYFHFINPAQKSRTNFSNHIKQNVKKLISVALHSLIRFTKLFKHQIHLVSFTSLRLYTRIIRVIRIFRNVLYLDQMVLLLISWLNKTLFRNIEQDAEIPNLSEWDICIWEIQLLHFPNWLTMKQRFFVLETKNLEYQFLVYVQ